MPKRRTLIREELDPQSLEGFTEAQKLFYASMGYKPYLNADEKVVWLSPELHGLRIYAKHRRPLLKRIFTGKNIQRPLRRKHRPFLVKFFKHNWLLFLILVGVMTFILYYMRYH
jgi:hypothetical protein